MTLTIHPGNDETMRIRAAVLLKRYHVKLIYTGYIVDSADSLSEAQTIADNINRDRTDDNPIACIKDTQI